MKTFFSALIFLFIYQHSFSQSLPSYLPENGLVAWYPFNGNVNDESGNGNHANNFGAVPTVDRLGIPNRAYSFNGSTNYIQTPINNFFFNKITLGIWFKTNIWKPYAGMFCSRAGNNLLNGLELINENGSKRLIFDLMHANNFHRIDHIDSTLADDQWHFVVGTFNGNSMKLYLDGNLVSQTDVSFQLSVQAFFKIGTDDIFGTVRSFQGSLDDAFIYNRELTSTEIQQIYQGSLTSTVSTEPLSDLHIYPNPSSGTFSVMVDIDLVGAKFSLFDHNGKIVQSGILSDTINQLNLSKLESGVYYLKIPKCYPKKIIMIKN